MERALCSGASASRISSSFGESICLPKRLLGDTRSAWEWMRWLRAGCQTIVVVKVDSLASRSSRNFGVQPTGTPKSGSCLLEGQAKVESPSTSLATAENLPPPGLPSTLVLVSF